jgi:hypothetical protein
LTSNKVNIYEDDEVDKEMADKETWKKVLENLIDNN